MGNTDYSFDTIFRTASGGSGLTGFENKTSINDSGKVAVVGKFGLSEDILVGDAVNPVINLSNGSRSKFSSPVQINNDDQVVAIDLASGPNFSSLSAIRLWDTNNPGSSRRNIATGNTNRSTEDFENIFPIVSLNNQFPEDQVAFLADPVGSDNTALETFAGDNQIGREYNELVQGDFRPMLADDGRVVVGDSSNSLVVRNYELNSIEPIANAADGFTNIGNTPGISDNGKAVAFYGEKSGKKGIFVSIDTNSGWVTHQVASISGDGILDPGGETFDDDGDGNVELGEDTGIISGFDSFQRIGITYGKNEILNSDPDTANVKDFGTVTYLAKDLSGNESLISTRFNISNSSNLNVTHSEVVKVGDSVNKFDPTLTGNIQDLNIYDPINVPGQIAFWAKTTNGDEAVVRANPIRKPVLIVPGIGGSLPDSKEDFEEWVVNRGFVPDRLKSDPLANTYSDLVESLKRAGYTEGVDLFVATHDWRLSPGPIDGSIDGVINRSIDELTDNTYEYSLTSPMVETHRIPS